MEKKRYIIPSSVTLQIDMGSLMDAQVSKTENGPGYGGSGNGGGMNGAKQSSFNLWSESEGYDEEE